MEKESTLLSVDKIVRSMQESSDLFAKWSRGECERYVYWHMARGLLVYCETKRGFAYQMARFLWNKGERIDPYYHDPEATICWIDYFYNGDDEAALNVVLKVIEKWSPKTHIAFKRDRKDDNSCTVVPVNYCLRYARNLVKKL